ncbi:aminopeptidase P family N-terminal domain-containing protein, partial [Enterococcus faecalis]|nr:aminopeptidase P family N-terminal domain-containing protein [Enterococcus faecalis]
TMKERKAKILNRMKTAGVECLIIYADLEHGSNFEYLVGFLPRFEEALLVLHATGEAYLILGNENLNKASKARIKNIPIHMPFFSLPNQPMNDRTVEEILGQSGIDNAKTIGIVGWKNFTSPVMENSKLFDTPNYLISAIQTIAPDAELTNETRLFIGDNGARTTMNANEFAHYEFGAALAGNCILD